MEVKERLINPIDGKPVDEIIKEKEARRRGYFDMEFMLRHLEDDNEFVKFFIVDGKKIVVDLEKPYLQYKHSTQINHERVHKEEELAPLPVVACSIDDPGCESCSG